MIKVKQNGKKVWVTFTVLPTDEMNNVIICGEWSEWQEEPMKQKKNGEFYVTKVLPAGSRFEFGYKINGDQWVLEEACAQVPSPFGGSNSVLEI